MNLRCCLIFSLLAAGWLCGQPLRASVAPSENPYTPIVERNVFGLVPIPVHNPADDVPVVPPPKITPNGIMTLFGKLQVLFKVAGVARPGLPPKDESYVMCEGDRQDDIEVQKIDQSSATITFNNHGVIQALPLVANAGGGAPALGIPAPGMALGHGGASLSSFGGRFGRGRGVTMGGNPGVVVPPPASPPAPAADSAPAEPEMTPEQQVLMIEAQRAKYIQEGDSTALILPPTDLTPQVTGKNEDGTPFTAPGP